MKCRTETSTRIRDKSTIPTNQSIPVAFATQRKTFQFFVLAILRLSPRVYFARPVASPAGLSPPGWPFSVSSIDWYITIAQRRSQCWWPTSVQCIRLRRLRYWQSRGQWGRPGGSVVTANISTSMRIKRMEKAWEESAVLEDGLHSDQTRQIKQYAPPPPPPTQERPWERDWYLTRNNPRPLRMGSQGFHSHKVKTYILPTFSREMYRKSSESWWCNHLSSELAVKSQVLHTVLCNLSGEAAGEIWNWSLLGVKGLRLFCASPSLQTLSHPSSKGSFSKLLKEKCISEVVRIGSIIFFCLSKLWKAKFFILCDSLLRWGCRGSLKLITTGSERVTRRRWSWGRRTSTKNPLTVHSQVQKVNSPNLPKE